ncbi:response regulator transcription factor [Noviherbaspirillum aerium]|uniref:response regulator transcription factor n=1 Tax=Noviherbaspirillum aerium TaxID=2588497 RepID=UPI00178C287F|nr:LuxR C-terminal-related transcriptional regulator [Noviherbaspirillum aerium]
MAKLVFIVDGDEDVQRTLSHLLRCSGYQVKVFSSLDSFESEPLPTGPACAIIDTQSCKAGCADALGLIEQKGVLLPVVFTTSHGSIPLAVCAMRAGAYAVLAKPVSDQDMLRTVNDAIGHAVEVIAAQGDVLEGVRRYQTLTPRERQVLCLAIGGLMNKQIAMQLGIQEITAKVHKYKVMEKMGTKSLIDLVRLADRLNIPHNMTRYPSTQRSRVPTAMRREYA